MSTFLTDDELIELTGAKRKSNQIRWLTQHRYPHETNANGAPKVLRCYLERRLGESTKTAGNQPNFGSIRKAS
jgi:hypothetical protein